MHDRIGEAIPEANCPYGVFLNPKNCEFGNASFLGIRKDGVLLFSIDGREERIREVCEDILSKASLASIEDDLIRFSRLQTKSDFAEYASEHGPLFGGTYLRENGIIEEPLSMWKLAASFFELAFRLKAVIDEDSWNESVYWDGKEVIFGSLIFLDKEQIREVAKKQRLTHKETEEAIFSASVVLPCAINPDYARFTMTEEEIQKRVYCSGRWDEPGAEMKYWHPFVKAIPNLMQMDILKGKMAMIEARAGFDVAIMLNPRRHAEMIGQGRLPSLVCPLEEFNASFRKEMGAKLCRSLMELLVSAHTKYVRHEWIGHNFTYYFEDRLRYMWFAFATYMDKKHVAICDYCGKPYMRTRSNQKRCPGECTRKAHKH